MLVVSCPAPYRVLSWAPLGGGLVQARTIINYQVRTDVRPTQEPANFLQTLTQKLRMPRPVVGLMTGVTMERLVRQTAQQHPLLVECCATVGLSNALAVGDPATYEEQPGTINLIVLVSRPLTPAALVEASAITTEAKVRALYEARVQSSVSDSQATGTGTDCVVIACPLGEPAYQHCGKHTQLGALLGQVVHKATREGLRYARKTR